MSAISGLPKLCPQRPIAAALVRTFAEFRAGVCTCPPSPTATAMLLVHTTPVPLRSCWRARQRFLAADLRLGSGPLGRFTRRPGVLEAVWPVMQRDAQHGLVGSARMFRPLRRNGRVTAHAVAAMRRAIMHWRSPLPHMFLCFESFASASPVCAFDIPPFSLY